MTPYVCPVTGSAHVPERIDPRDYDSWRMTGTKCAECGARLEAER